MRRHPLIVNGIGAPDLVNFQRPSRGPGAIPATREGEPRDWFSIDVRDAAGEADIYLYDEIGFWGTSAQSFVDKLNAIGTATVNVFINSPGGEVFDGLAIYNALRRHSATVRTQVDGMAASAASFIFMAGDERVAARNSEIMIHDAIGLCWGNAGEMKEYADLLDHVSENIADIYSHRATSDLDNGEWRTLMRAETWFSGAEAVSFGLAHELGHDAPDDAGTDEEIEDAAAADRVRILNEAMRKTYDLSACRYQGRRAAPSPLASYRKLRNRADDVIPVIEPPAGVPVGSKVESSAGSDDWNEVIDWATAQFEDSRWSVAWMEGKTSSNVDSTKDDDTETLFAALREGK